MAESSIEWTEQTWNPTTGCTKVSAGCRDCYAEIMHRRLRAMGQAKYSEPFTIVRTHESELDIPLRRKKPTTYFVNSMSDLFHDDVPLAFIKQVFAVMNQCHWHTFQVLTKRPENAYKYSDQLTWTPNIWMGTSVEDERVKWRLDFLTETGAKVKFLSLEPLIGPLPNLSLAGIHWVIVGGESGRNMPRPMQANWVEDIRNQCEQAGVAFFFKQWGGKNKKASGRLLNGRTYDAMPNLPIDQVQLSSEELYIMGHTLGVSPHAAKRAKRVRDKQLPAEFYRNYFNASAGHSDYRCLQELVRKGVMFINPTNANYYHVSETGMYVFRREFNRFLSTKEESTL